MANYKRKKSKRQIKCALCTQHRWKGNGKERHSHKDRQSKTEKAEQKSATKLTRKSMQSGR